MVESSSNLRTRKSHQDLGQLLRSSNAVSDERVFNEHDGLLSGNSSAEVINMTSLDNKWKDLQKPSRKQKIFNSICSLSVCMTLLFILFVTGFFALVVKLSSSGLRQYPHKKIQLFYNGSTYYDTTVIYISLDGFRNDYLDRNVTPNIDLITQQGIKAEYMTPSFPSITFPNHWTLATGLYPESHGIVANEFYDPETKKSFVHLNASISADSKWWGGEPIWVTSTKQDKKSAVIMWPGSNALINSVKADYVVPFHTASTANEKMDTVLNWLDLLFTERPQTISVYVPQIDQNGHDQGPDGPQMNDVLKDMDDAIGYLIDGLTQRNLQDHVHIVLVSDHGMASSDSSKYIYYDHFISEKSQSYLRDREAWPLLGLRLKDDAPQDALDKIYNEITTYISTVDNPHFQVFKRQDIPSRFHYNATDRIAPLILLPDVGYAIIKSTDTMVPPKGIHGYDNSALEMRALFAAKGPNVNRMYNPGSVVDPFENVEVYRFLTVLLDLEPAPNNATLDGMFRTRNK